MSSTCPPNPTGPLHIGHCRGAVVGDALANLLDKASYRVTREYYINDAGAQIEALARSVHWRYCEQLAGSEAGKPHEVPAGTISGRLSDSGGEGSGSRGAG